MQIRPLWVFVIWTFLFLFCFYIIYHYFADRWAQSAESLIEGMGENAAAAATSSKSGDPDLEEGQRKYFPDPSIKNVFRVFRVGDLADETVELFEFIKVDIESVINDSSANDASSNATTSNSGSTDTFGEYKQSVNDLSIYKSYNSVASNYDKYFDRLMGHHFDSAKIEELLKDAKTPREKRRRIYEGFTKDLVKEDETMRFVLVHCFPEMQTHKSSSDLSGNDTTKSSSEATGGPLSSYFGDLIVKYADGKAQLEQIKKAFADLLKPVILMKWLCDNYEKEEERYRNADGKTGKNDSAKYFLNTMGDLLKKWNPEKSSASYKINGNNYVHVFDDDKADAESTELPLDAVRIYVYTEYVYRAYQLLPNSTTIKMSKETFAGGFPAYLKKKTDNKRESLLVYLLQNPPTKQ